MRRLTFILIGFVLIFCSCRSITLSNDIPADYDFKYDIYSHIRMYFRANLKYPSVDELRNFCWEIINEANDNIFSSFEEYDNAPQKIATGREDLLRCLLSNSNEISFEQETKAMYVLWKGRKWIKIEFDLCEMIKTRSYLFTYFYDSDGHYTMDFDYAEELYKMGRDMREKYLTDSVHFNGFKPSLLRYDRNKRYQVCCPLNCEVKQNAYFNEFGCALDTFLLNRDIQMVQFVIGLPECYFVRK